jgi:rsbT antagonist protein RsbS
MGLSTDISPIAIQVSRGVVVASIQTDLDDDTVARFREDLLGCVHRTGSRGVILDVSALEVIDAHEFAALRDLTTMVGLLGAEAILVGLQAGVVSALIELDADVEGVQAAINLDAGFELLQPENEVEREPEPEPEPEPEAEAGEADELEAPMGEGPDPAQWEEA